MRRTTPLQILAQVSLPIVTLLPFQTFDLGWLTGNADISANDLLCSYCRSGIYQSNGRRWRRGHHSWKRTFQFLRITTFSSPGVFSAGAVAPRSRTTPSGPKLVANVIGIPGAWAPRPQANLSGALYSNCMSWPARLFPTTFSVKKATSLVISLALSGPDYRSPIAN